MDQKQKSLLKERLWIILCLIVIVIVSYIAIKWFANSM
jgi:hypothetical protein